MQGRQNDVTPIHLAQELLDDITARTGEEASVEQLWGQSQKALSVNVDLKCLSILKDQVVELGQVREVARLASLSLPRAGAWLLCPPIPALGLRLQPSEFVLATKYRLGCHVYDQEGPCPACLQHSDRFGDHALCCGHWGERISRHNAIRDHVHQMAATAVLNPVKEGRFLLPGNDRRPADVYLPNWAEGRDAAIDVTVINPLQQQTVVEAAATPGHSLAFAYERKMRGAAEDCERQGIAFIPLAFESLGGWHRTAEDQVRRIAQAVARQTGRDESECISQATSRLSLLLMKGNAAILSNRIPSPPEAFIDGVQ